MEVLYGKMNDVSFMVSAVVKYRESYVGPYVLYGDEEEFGRTSPIEQEIKENPDVCGYVIRSKAWQLDDKAELSPIYVDHYVMIGTREVDPLSSKNAGGVRLENVTLPSMVTSIGTSVFNANNNLKKIINKTGRSFNWKSLVNGSSEATFETGTVKTGHGDIIVTKE